MIELHAHTFMSDGVLSISELVYRAKLTGYTTIAITDHADYSNYKEIIDAAKTVKPSLEEGYEIQVLPGVELTYVPPEDLKDLVKKCRDYGAEIVVVHGETVAENVPKLTNLKAIEARVDVLAHPGEITEDEVKLAKENDVCLEITSRNWHTQTNAHVAGLANKIGTKLVFCNDVHLPENILSKTQILSILTGLGLSEKDYEKMQANAREKICRKNNS